MAAPRVAMPVAQPVARSSAAHAAAAAPVAQAVVRSNAAAASSSHHAAVAAPVAAAVAVDKEEEIDARLLMDMPSTRAYALVDGAKQLVEDGMLQVMESRLDGEDVYLIILGKMRLALNRNIPCLEMAERNYIFPTDGSTYGIVVSEAITDDVLDVFRTLLSENTSFRSAAAPQPITALPDKPDKVVKIAGKVSAGLGAGSVVVATGVIKGGKMVGRILTRGGEFLTSKLKPNEKASTISADTKSKIAKAKFLSGAAVKVSKALVVGAMATTQMMSKQLSSAIKDTDIGKKLNSDPEHPNPRIDAAKNVGAATIGAVLNVYQALETAVFGVVHDAAAATVTVVTHKYGSEAGESTKESLGVVENVALAAHSMSKVGVKSIAKRVAINSAKDVLETPSERAAREAEEAEERKSAPDENGGSRQAIGAALGLPAGIDPLMALEAVQAAAHLQNAAAPYLGPAAASAASRSHDEVTVTTAVATGATPALAQAAAHAAATSSAQKADAQYFE